MIHVGDITKLDGATLPPVDVITGGSPCQDLSVAGKREGLSGERSSLFLEQVRIVKEMREHDIRMGKTNVTARPRFMVWENVPGAFSSNKGKDFQKVLTEIVRIVEPNAPDVPLFGGKKKWDSAGCLYDDMGRWSIAWRVHDAQFWGVPQRRKRIALVADFGGKCAPEILFERKSLQGDIEQGEEEGETVTGSPGESIDPAVILLESNQNNATIQTDVSTALPASMGMGGYVPMVTGFDAYKHHGWRESDTVNPLTAEQNNSVRGDTPLVCYGISAYESNAMRSDNPHSGVYEADTARTLDNNGGNPACNQGGMAVVFDGSSITSPVNASCPQPGDPCHTLHDDSRNYVIFEPRSQDGVPRVINDDVSPTLNTIGGGGAHQR